MQDDSETPIVPPDNTSSNVSGSPQPTEPTPPSLPSFGPEPTNMNETPNQGIVEPTPAASSMPSIPSFGHPSNETDALPSFGTDTLPGPGVVSPMPPSLSTSSSSFSSPPPVSGADFAGSPQVHGPVFNGQGMGMTGSSLPPQKPKRKSILWAGIVAALIVLLGAGYFFAIYLPNTPSHIYSSSLANSGLALDRLIEYSKQQEHASYSTMTFSGAIHSKSPDDSYDIDLSGAFDKNANANVQLNTDAMGVKFSTDVMSIKAAGNTSPDVYVKLTGIKSFLDSLGLNQYDNLDGQWIVIDHTLIDTYMSSYKQELGSSGSTTQSSMPTYADVEDALAKVQTVNKEYLFSTSSTKAVFTNQKFLGKETSGGQTLDHYKVGYSKAHLDAYIAAVGQALNSSQLNSWYKGTSDGKNISQEMNIPSLQNRVKGIKSNYTFDLWANTKTKLVAKVSLTDPFNSSSIFSLGQNYTGGTTYPLTFGFTGKDSSGNPYATSLLLTLNTSTNKASLSYTSNTTASSGISTTTANVSITPSNSPVKVTAPKGAKSLTDILISLGLGSLANGDTQSTTSSQTLPGAITQSLEHTCAPTSMKKAAVCE